MAEPMSQTPVSAAQPEPPRWPRSAFPAIAVILLFVGCASTTMTERIVNEARKGLVWEADYIPREGGRPEALAALYEHLTVELRIDVEYLPADDDRLLGAFGISYLKGGRPFIKLRQDLSINGTIEVAAHEAAQEGDVFAEIVSAHVAERLGVPDAVATAALWLRQHKASLRMALDLQMEIHHVANMLMPGSGARVVTRAEP